MQSVYETDRLILKMLGVEHAGLVLDYHLRNMEFLRPWEALRDETYFTVEFHEKILENDLAGFLNGTSLRLWVFKKGCAERVIGLVAFNELVRGSFQSCFLGYKLDKDEINKGYMTEAVRKGIDVMFNDYRLHRIEANIMPSNRPSLRVVQKLGFHNEGLASKYLKINGRWEDHLHWVLLNDALE
ncbi:MAG: GNAT family N-acetyltransferase [Firmicutes bacterium]|nr:GNAT family N-acetyltransferase [Bacillota bacterium]